MAVKSLAEPLALELVAGIEFSSTWSKVGIHIVGLNMNVADSQLLEGIDQQQLARKRRGHMIAERLEKKGFLGAYEGALAEANGSQIGRPHFARFLVSNGYVSSFKQAFKKHLGAGKAGDVKAVWPSMKQVVEWITRSGGVAVLAHPLHYKMTATKLRALIADFKEAGGLAIEVVSGVQPNDHTPHLAALAEQFDLYSSCGSDFHNLDSHWGDLGQMSALPSTSRPVWSLW